MDQIDKLGKLIQEVSELFNSIDITSQMKLLGEENQKLKNEMKELIENYNQKCDELSNCKNKYDKEIVSKNKEIKEKNEELTRLTKISLIQQYDKQLKDKNDYIKILESQLEKYKNSSKPQSPKLSEIVVQEELPKVDVSVKTNEPVPEPKPGQVQVEEQEPVKEKSKKKKSKKNIEETVEPEPVEEPEPVKEPETEVQTEKPKKKKTKEPVEKEFNPDEFEDINGYELLIYKNVYYLRDLETNELYSIINNQPDQVVGLINSKRRVKFN